MDESIKILGLGGAGINVLESLKYDSSKKISFCGIDTDIKSLNSVKSIDTLLVGENICRGLGCGGDYELARKAILDDKDKILGLIKDTQIVILIGALGGGSGSALIETIGELTVNEDILILGFFITPFSFEGSRYKSSESIFNLCRSYFNGVFKIHNNILLQEDNTEITVENSLKKGNLWVIDTIKLILDLHLKKGVMDQNLGCLKKVFNKKGGKSIFAICNEKDNFIINLESIDILIKNFLMSPLLFVEGRPKSLDSLIVIIKGSKDLELSHIDYIVSKIVENFEFKNDVNIASFTDDSLINTLEICILGKTELNSIVSIKKEIKTHQTKVHTSKLIGQITNSKNVQVELDFLENNENSGYFQDEDKTIHKDVNLDIPTYLRNGVRIKYK